MKLSRRWVSSQILLLVIAGWVCGLGLIHHVWLVPSIKSHMARQESGVAVRWVEQALSGVARERKALAQWGEGWSRSRQLQGMLADPDNTALADDLAQGLGPVGLMVCDPAERVVSTHGWLTETSKVRPEPAFSPGQKLHGGPVFPAGWTDPVLTGILATPGRICLFARQPIGSPESPAGYVVFIRAMDWPMLQDLSAVTGVQVTVLDSLSPGQNTSAVDMEHVRSRSSGHGSMAAEVNLRDTLGRPVGRLQVDGSIMDIDASGQKVRSAYLVQLSWLMVAALITFGVVYMLFIRPLAILVRRLGDSEVTQNREDLSVGLFAEAGVVARKFTTVLDRIVVLSETDPLTGLSNRRQFQILLDHEFHLAKRHGHDLSVMMMDIDHFKKVNDTYGHLVGDQVLQMVAETIRHVSRRSDVCARYGGEEFAIILPHTNMDQAAALSERLREQLATEWVETVDGSVKVTISVGVSAVPELSCPRAEELVDQADQSLYKAKRSGRNRTVVARDQDESGQRSGGEQEATAVK